MNYRDRLRAEVDNAGVEAVAPFLRWAGGKRWPLPVAARIRPQQFARDIEPFLGRGPVFFPLRPARPRSGASTRTGPSGFESVRLTRVALEATEPAARRWSPPRTTGRAPASSDASALS